MTSDNLHGPALAVRDPELPLLKREARSSPVTRARVASRGRGSLTRSALRKALRLPDAEHRPGGIREHRHATDVHHIHRLHQDATARRLSVVAGLLGVRDTDVRGPGSRLGPRAAARSGQHAVAVLPKDAEP
jgi:hypothetical protein